MSDADCQHYLETQRLGRQTCCKYEPRFDSPDNIMFHTTSDVLSHDANEYCSQYADMPHDADKCGFWKRLNAESAGVLTVVAPTTLPNRAGGIV